MMRGLEIFQAAIIAQSAAVARRLKGKEKAKDRYIHRPSETFRRPVAVALVHIIARFQRQSALRPAAAIATAYILKRLRATHADKIHSPELSRAP